MELPEPDLPRQPATPLDPTTVVSQHSLLTTHLAADLTPLVSASERKLTELADELVGDGRPPRPRDPKPSGSGKGEKEQKSGTESKPAPAQGKSEPNDVKDPAEKDASTGKDTPSRKAASADKKGPHADWPEIEEGVRVMWRASRTDTHAHLENETLRVEITFKYAAAVVRERAGWRRPVIHACGCDGEEWCGRKRGARRRAIARWSVPLALGSDLKLEGKPEFTLETPDDCKLPGARGKPLVDFKARALASLAELGEKGSKRLGTLLDSFKGIQNTVEPFWQSLHTAVPIHPESGPWFMLRPRALEAGPMAVRSGRASFPVRTAVNPVLSPWPPDKSKVTPPWPPPSDLGDAEGFRVAARLELEIEALKSQLATLFLRRRFPRRDIDYVEITEVDLYKSRGNVVVNLTLEGTAKGEIAFTGRLHADAETDTLSVVDFELAEASREGLARLYDEVERADLSRKQVPWIDAEKLKEEVLRFCQWPIGNRLRSLERKTELVARQAALPTHKLWFAMEDYAFANVSVSANAIQTLLIMSGRATLERTGDTPAPAGDPRPSSESKNTTAR